MSTATEILNEFNAAESNTPSYSSVYGNRSASAGRGFTPPTIPVNENYITPSNVGSSAQSIEDAFNYAVDQVPSYSQIYPNAGKTESIQQASRQDANIAAVRDIPFGFANALFENQLTPEDVNSIVSSKGSPAAQNSFLQNTFSFLTPRVTPVQASTVLNEFGISKPSGALPGGAAGSGIYAPSNGPTSDASALTPYHTNASMDPAQQQPQQQQPQQNQQGSGPLGGGSNSNPLSPIGSGLLASIEKFIHDHPLLTVGILAVMALVLFGGHSGGGKRR